MQPFHASQIDDSIPVVSVVMPIYNSAKFLALAIDSILAQSFPDFELLIIDDASTDNGADIINCYQDLRIRYVKNEKNVGVAASRNCGIKLARGEFIAQMDQDDIARPNRLALQVSFLRANPEIGLCGGQIIKMMGNSRHLVQYPCDHDEICVTLLFHSCFAHPTVMARRKILIEHNLFYDEGFRNLEDYELWTRLVEKTRTSNLPNVLLDYRCHQHQLSGESSDLVYSLRRRLHRRVISRFIQSPSEEELLLHGMISIHHDPFNGEQLKRSENWLIKLLQANDRMGVYERKAMQKVFSSRWAAVCGQAMPLTIRVYWLFLLSPLSNGALFTLRSLKLLVKCILSKTYA